MGGTKRIGFLADTHSRVADGSDLPDGVLRAFADVDVIVHLGDVGRKGILDRLGAVAPVYVPAGDGKGYVPVADPAATPVKVLASDTATVGLHFNLRQPDKKIEVADDGTITWPEGPIAPLLLRRFKQPVDAVAFGGTHRVHEEVHDGILFFNPGSPNLPSDGAGGVAVLDLGGNEPKVSLVRL